MVEQLKCIYREELYIIFFIVPVKVNAKSQLKKVKVKAKSQLRKVKVKAKCQLIKFKVKAKSQRRKSQSQR